MSNEKHYLFISVGSEGVGGWEQHFNIFLNFLRLSSDVKYEAAILIFGLKSANMDLVFPLSQVHCIPLCYLVHLLK